MNGRYRDVSVVAHCQSMPPLMLLLGGGLRLELLRHLALQSWNVGDLADLLEADQPLVSHDLAQLRKRGLVTVRRDGLYHWYELTPQVTAVVDGEQLTLHLRTSDGDEMTIMTQTPKARQSSMERACAARLASLEECHNAGSQSPPGDLQH